ncbi:hypothetical protein [Methylomicrobium lacus]|uniref:hypothetical protein n=1 Tax=Methylomicrobium lacus TaxID=136992 RepID=UPI0035A82AD9
MTTLIKYVTVSILFLLPMVLKAEVRFKQIAQFDIPEAKQGIAVDRDYFYAVDNRAIAKYWKHSGRLVTRWEARPGGPIIHLDSAVAIDGKIYAAHSNWPHLPIGSSVEIWNASTLQHIRTHRLDRPEWGSLTWLDYHDGCWWGTFAHYDRVGPDGKPYGGGKSKAILAKFDSDWNLLQSWTFPADVLQKFGAMSNSGGSWGPDGFLYVTGHDLAEIYKMQIPHAGTVLDWVGTLPLNIRGQGIAWDRHAGNALYGIIRATDEEVRRGVSNQVVVFRSGIKSR